METRERLGCGWLTAWGCGSLAGGYVIAYFVLRLMHVLVNYGYRIRTEHGFTVLDIVFVPLVELERLVRGIG